MSVIVADASLLGLAELAPNDYEIRSYCGRTIPEEILDQAVGIFIRSTTRLDAAALPETVRFVGTATVGVDHLPIETLNERGIRIASAPGCNARAVTDYVLATLFDWVDWRQKDIETLTLGVLGVGQVGSRLISRAKKLGITVLGSDLPRADRGEFSDHVPLDVLLRQADVLSVHVPLTKVMPYQTEYFLTHELLAILRPGSLLINAARGPLVLVDDLLQSLHFDVVLDVFPNEPFIEDVLLDRSWRVTPHIAGHSVEGKLRGTELILRQFCELMGKSLPSMNRPDFLDSIARQVSSGGSEIERVRSNCSLAAVCEDLRTSLLGSAANKRSEIFDRVRANYPLRRESIVLPNSNFY
jgi:erythronate-4-phosphate dehydrogenase